MFDFRPAGPRAWLIVRKLKPAKTRARRRLMLEALSQRVEMAADLASDWMDFSEAHVFQDDLGRPSYGGGLTAEGEAAPDLVAFAKALRDSGAVLYGADWSPHTIEQLRRFDDGAEYLNFVEVTDSHRQPNAVALEQNITAYPTWVFADGSRLAGGQDVETLAARIGQPIPQSAAPSFVPISNQVVLSGSPLHIPIDAYDPNGNPLTITVTSSSPDVVAAEVLGGSRSVRTTIKDRGEIVFELFEKDAPKTTAHFIDLINAGFYNSTSNTEMLFHRTIDKFVIQTGQSDVPGPTVNVEFDTDLQYNRSGVVGVGRAAARDSGTTQFFITDLATRFLDMRYSIFGQVVEGDRVRQGISRGATDLQDRPITDIPISEMKVFNDTENGLIRLTSLGAPGQSATIRVTVSDTEGNSTSQEFQAVAQADTVNSQPFLNPLPKQLTTRAGVPVQIQATSQDVEGDQPIYSASLIGSTAANVQVNSRTGQITVTPQTDFVGTLTLRVSVTAAGVGPDVDNADILINVVADQDVRNSISGYVYVDGDNNGSRWWTNNGQTIAQMGIPNVLIQLQTLDGRVQQEVHTGADGRYVFSNVPSGRYKLVEFQPVRFADGRDTAGAAYSLGASDNDTFLVELRGGVAGTEFNFGEVGLVAALIGPRLRLASTATPAEQMAALEGGDIQSFVAASDGTLKLSSAAPGQWLQIMNAEGETLAGSTTGELTYAISASSKVYVTARMPNQLQFTSNQAAPSVAAPSVAGALTNPSIASDVNKDKVVSALDALLVINELNQKGSRQLSGRDLALADMIDVNGDGWVTAMDALMIINNINEQVAAGEGEGELDDFALTWLESEQLRGRRFGVR